MEADLINRALNAAPWLAPVLAIIILMRKEILALLTSGRGDSAVEGLMGQMVSQFGENMKHFERLSVNSEKWLDEQRRTTAAVEAMHETQRMIHTEMVRGSANRGG